MEFNHLNTLNVISEIFNKKVNYQNNIYEKKSLDSN